MPTLSNITTETYHEHLKNEFQNLKAIIFQYEEALSGLADYKIQSYEIDTGQNKTRVTRQDLAALQTAHDIATARLAELAACLGYTHSVQQMRPGW